MFWTPAFAGVTTKETFYELINFVGAAFQPRSSRLKASHGVAKKTKLKGIEGGVESRPPGCQQAV
jgi:hypothetical protein